VADMVEVQAFELLPVVKSGSNQFNKG